MLKEIKQVSSSRKSTNFVRKDLSLKLCEFFEEKKAYDILLLDLHAVNSYFDYFLIASAKSRLHLNSLSQEVSRRFAKGNSMGSSSTDSHSGWVILDFIDIVVHLFLEEQRLFYNLERLWGDASMIYPTEAAKPKAVFYVK